LNDARSHLAILVGAAASCSFLQASEKGLNFTAIPSSGTTKKAHPGSENMNEPA